MVGTRRVEDLAAAVRALVPEPDAGRFVVALSGGADSAIAAWLMLDSGRQCRAVHVDHGLIGSPGMRVAAVAIAQKLGLDLEVRDVEVPVGASPEDQARTVRYATLEASLSEDEWLVTGHTRDDQAETVLLNLLRGAGLDGLAGIPRRRERIVRPILDVARSQTRELATLLGLPWRDDPSNDDLDPRRNQLRRAVIPDLEERFNPQLRTSLASLADAVATGVPPGSLRVQVRAGEDGVAVCAPELYAVGTVAAAHVLREALRRVRGPHAGTRDEVGRLALVAMGDISSTELAGGVHAYRSGPWLVVGTSNRTVESLPVGWTLPGEARFGGWSLASWIDDRAPDAFPLSAWRAVADADLMPNPLEIRGTVDGDQVDGVLVAEVLRQLGVPAERRSMWPVVEAKGTIVWVPGARISRSVWVGSATRRYLWVHAALETV